jgi:hypothetical protein
MTRRGRPFARPSNHKDRVNSLLELCHRLGTSYRTVLRLRRDGLEPELDGRFSVAKAMRLLQQRRQRSNRYFDCPVAPEDRHSVLDEFQILRDLSKIE